MRTGTLEGFKKWILMTEEERNKLIREYENSRKKVGAE